MSTPSDTSTAQDDAQSPRLHLVGADLEPAEFDALADLFIGESPAPAPRPAHADSEQAKTPRTINKPAEARVEAVLLGHLPVLGAVWVSQYASQRALDENAPVGLISLAGDESRVEIFGASSAADRQTKTLADAIAVAAARTSTWLIRGDEAACQSLLDGSDAPDDITLLTGADEAAVVASYRLIKSIVAGTHADDEESPQLKLSVMGAPPDRADQAVSRISRAVASHLGRAIHVEACVSQITPRGGAMLYHGPCDAPVCDIVPWIRRCVEEAEAPAVNIAPATPPPPAPDRPARPSKPIQNRQLDPIELEPPSAVSPKSARTPSLAALIDGLTPLDIRCPYASNIELALDKTGSLHLIASDPASAGSDLLTVDAWSRAHASLIAQAVTSLSPGWQSHRHIVVENAPPARGLLDADVRVHLCIEVPTQSGPVRVTRPLN